ncbi:MAG: DegT/DnrJ/EryC1/StrS family aminotransferase [Magnetococcales bacterium]|nr:DegT/DnrJ/EryC1/StrS family aminotransferase [Magnetococcales bacterium]
MQFIDLQAQYRAYQEPIDAAIRQVLASSRYIHGPQVAELEKVLADFVGADHGVGLSSGTDSLTAILMAWGIGPGDEVITTPFTFIATAEVIAGLGAVPVFVDVEDEALTLDPTRLEAAITPRTKAIIPVSLFGQCADFDAIDAIANQHGLLTLEDACQSLGGTYKGRPSGSLGTAGATSFFPAKPLGCYGDGGMAFTNDEELAANMRIIRDHGQDARYRHRIVGMNSRLDTIQAAILLAKMPFFKGEIEARQRVAAYYMEQLQGKVRLPHVLAHNTSVFSQFTVRVANRDVVQQRMGEAGIPTAVHYPVCLHQQPVFKDLGYPEDAFPISSKAADEVLSLPMHPFLTPADQDRVVAALLEILASA